MIPKLLHLLEEGQKIIPQFRPDYKYWENWLPYIDFSKSFLYFVANKVEALLFQEYGIKTSQKLFLSTPSIGSNVLNENHGDTFSILMGLGLKPDWVFNFTFKWKSKSGKSIPPNSEDFDEEDIECWIEGLNYSYVIGLLNPKGEPHPFKTKNLPFAVEVLGWYVDMGITVQLSSTENAEKIIAAMGKVISDHNNKSEAKDRALGVVHNSSAKVEGNEIIFRIDVGSAGVSIINKILTSLKKFAEVEKVVLDY